MEDFLKKQKLLVIAPHSDDEVLGCGGTIVKINDFGGKVFVIVVSIGDLSHYLHDLKTTKMETRKKEMINALNFLRIEDFEIIFENNEKYMRLDSIPQRDLIEIIENKAKLSIEKLKPTMLAIPSPSYNQDHTAIFKAGFATCRPHIRHKKHLCSIVLVYESPVNFWNYHNFKPNFYVDISEYLNKKLKALSFHRSQISKYPDIMSPKIVESLAKLRGAEIGVFAAEAYQCLRFTI